MRIGAIGLILILSGCSHLDENSKSLVGKWSWNFTTDDARCYHSGILSLRGDGKYSVSSEGGCEAVLASDSFGIHRSGWYIAENMVCLSTDSKELEFRELTENCKTRGYKINSSPDGKRTLSQQLELGGVTHHVGLSRI